MSSPDARREKQLWSGHPSRRGLIGLHVKLVLGAIATTAVFWALASHGALSWLIFAIAAFAIDGGILWFLRIYPRMTTFTVTTECIYDTRFNLRTWGSKTERARVSRIQNVTVEQSLFARILGIGSVDSNTAGEFEGDLFRWVGVHNPQRVASLIEDAMYGPDDAERDSHPPHRQESV